MILPIPIAYTYICRRPLDALPRRAGPRERGVGQGDAGGAPEGEERKYTANDEIRN